MNVLRIVVHYPKTQEKQAMLDVRVAKFHAEYVAGYIEKLHCPTEQKIKLLDSVVKTVLSGSQGKNSV